MLVQFPHKKKKLPKPTFFEPKNTQKWSQKAALKNSPKKYKSP